MEQWADRREAELQRQAAKLISRERSLDAREVTLRQHQAKLQDEQAAHKRAMWSLQKQLAEHVKATQKKGDAKASP